MLLEYTGMYHWLDNTSVSLWGLHRREQVSLIAHISDQHFYIGKGVMLDTDLELGFPDKPIEKLHIGDHVTLYGGKIAPKTLVIGDYTKIHDGVWCFGRSDCYIGYNSWFGRNCTLDCEGGFHVGDGFGAGEESKLWSHIRHGDILEGCRYLGFGKFRCGDDVWFVGRCSASPVRVADRVVIFNESNVTKDIPNSNSVWAGNPAKEITDKLGPPYLGRTTYGKEKVFEDYIKIYLKKYPQDKARVALFQSGMSFAGRSYTKRLCDPDFEARFMKFLLPEVKLVPSGERLPNYE